MVLQSVSAPPVDLDECPNCDSVLSSLEVEQKETARLQKENKALVNGIFQLQKEVLLLFLLVVSSMEEFSYSVSLFYRREICKRSSNSKLTGVTAYQSS